MADEPIGEPKPPMPLPQPMARRMGRARRLFVMSFSPTKWSMATAMGQKMAATTTFGRKTESRVEARNQTKIWFFIEVPMQQSVLTEILRSSPVVVHVRQMRSEPKSRTAISEKYWLSTWPSGIRSKKESTRIGMKAVT